MTSFIVAALFLFLASVFVALASLSPLAAIFFSACAGISCAISALLFAGWLIRATRGER